MRRDPGIVEKLLQSSQLWRGGNAPQITDGLPTGYEQLDRLLPGGGWPQQALTEILAEHHGIGELRLFMPALVRLSVEDRQKDMVEPRWIAWVAPPLEPYPPALQQWGLNLSRVLIVRPRGNSEMLWSAEQALSSGTCAAVLLWPEQLDDRASRRLQLAAERGGSWAIAFRSLTAREQPSAAALRIMLQTTGSGISVNILKSRGGRPAILHDVL